MQNRINNSRAFNAMDTEFLMIELINCLSAWKILEYLLLLQDEDEVLWCKI